MDNTAKQQPPASTDTLERGPWVLAIGGLLLFFFAWRLAGDESSFWLPGLGVGITLLAWFGLRALAILTPLLFVARLFSNGDAGVLIALADTLCHAGLIGASWWLYYHVAKGSNWLDDPRSATTFLLLVPGGLAALFALIQASYLPSARPFGVVAAEFWLSRMTGIMITAPFLIVVCTPLLQRYGLVTLELPPAFFGEREVTTSRLGEGVELAGLTFSCTVLALLLLWTPVPGSVANWLLWAGCLVLIVWTCIRQGLVGGCFTAGVTSFVVVSAAHAIPLELRPAVQSGVQGHLLALCSSALLVGVSASWVRANEKRYRHVVSRIPFLVYSARLPAGLEIARDPSKRDHRARRDISKLALVMLVSPAAKSIFGCEPDSMIGPFAAWLDRIEPADRELVVASLGQLCLQEQPVTCEYRVRQESSEAIEPRAAGTAYRWLRDTMTPHYSEEGLVDGWEGLVEDITDQRTLSHNLRKMTNMLQVLVTNLPTGVYFVQAPHGNPILVNPRARQLLGQREDLSTGLSHLTQIFRLHKPDGSEYPAEELPVCKALKLGTSCRANDIVVHRADGRKIPLITWAAPIDLHNTGKPDAAVWVLEDWTTIQQAQSALRESELRLRAVIETMEEGVIVQDDSGAVIDCNASACAILGMQRETLLGRRGLAPKNGCTQESGAPFAADQVPDQRALREQQPIRGVVLGFKPESSEETRWLLVNSLPLPVGPVIGMNHQKARVVTTFADITLQLQSQASLRLTRDKYQGLVESLPFMLQLRDRDFNITYVNPAGTQITGYSSEELSQKDFCQSIIFPEDWPAYTATAERVAHGESDRVELRLRAKDGAAKTVLSFVFPNLHNGEIAGATCMVIDITMQRRLEEELHLAKHLELVGRLASGTVHDFNNLLTVLMGMAGLAKTEVPADHPVCQYLTRIEEVGEQASHLTGQLLTFSKQRPRQHRPVDINLLVAQTLKLAQSVIPPEIKIDLLLDPQAPIVLGDEVPFKQVVMNLCLNARDAMPAGGTLTIRTSHGSPAGENNGRQWMRLSIADTGHGMPADVRDRIFEPFFSTKERGTGLGLAVVQKIISEFGGKIEVWSEPEKGTRFDIWLVRDAHPLVSQGE